MLLLELEWRQVVQAAVRPDGVEVKAPGFDNDLRLGRRSEPVDAQALVAELAIEALVVGVLPTANALGLKIPQTILLQAARVIE